MQRYTVSIVTPGDPSQRPVLLVPFQPSAVVVAFVEELYKRIARQGLAITPNTHIATLHLDSETGGLIDHEDILADVVLSPQTDRIFAVFDKKNPTTEVLPPLPQHEATGKKLKLRIVTPANAKDKNACTTIELPVSSTVRDLHQRICEELSIDHNVETDADKLECNCKLAVDLSDGSALPDSFLVVHGKSVVERIPLDNQTENSIKTALRSRLGTHFDDAKRVAMLGAEMHTGLASVYKKNPVVAVCSKKRHTPAHARIDANDANQRRTTVVDLHTHEQPIHPASMDATLEETGIGGLADQQGVVDIYTVSRRTTGASAASIGKSNIYRARAHWEPPIVQSPRGVAMFLSSLRVFASLVQDLDERAQDSVMHTFELLTGFPPAVRTLWMLSQGKTPTAVESAALGLAVYEAIDRFMSPHLEDLIGKNHMRNFECSRLFFGFVLEKARTLKLSGDGLPYMDSFQEVDLHDVRTNEPVMRAMGTGEGLVEAGLFHAFVEGNILATSHLQTYMTRADVESSTTRAAFLSGGVCSDLLIFSKAALAANCRYPDAGNLEAAVDINELSELDHLAEICGRNKLAVHRPSQLSSAVTPSLTFDRNAHLAVYTGEVGCGEPGRSSILSRPQHGDETVDTGVIEQLIAPILATYEADGTAVFDATGGAAVRRLQCPDEILMFCIDCSASMRRSTDFAEVNDADEGDSLPDTNSAAQSLVEAEYYNKTALDDVKESLISHEAWDDLVAMCSTTGVHTRRQVSRQILNILRAHLSSSIVKKAERLERKRQHGRGWYHIQQQVKELETDLDKLKLFWCGLKTHEEAVLDFLIYRAVTAPDDVARTWTWSMGDTPPTVGPALEIPTLPEDITDIPFDLSCPISHTLMLDAVTAADGQTYSKTAITHWFEVRQSSPMTGLPLVDISLRSNQEICDRAQRWMLGDEISGRERPSSPLLKRVKLKELVITFDSKDGSFSRTVSRTMTLSQLYQLAFRGLKGRYLVFQLSTDRYGPLLPSPEATLASREIGAGDHITIRIADDDPTSGNTTSSASTANERVLVKVYQTPDAPLFSYWAKRATTSRTVSSIIFKYWRYRFQQGPVIVDDERQIWSDMSSSGDNLLSGHPLENEDPLSQLFTPSHCFGHLGAEKVYREDNISSSSGSPQPMVLKLHVEKKRNPKREDHRLSRLDVLKQMFEALINRILAYNYKNHVGLITFASTPTMEMSVSHILENFRRSVSRMHATGDTALWDALSLGLDQLLEYSKKYPQAKKRMIVISDGRDTKSTNNTAEEVCWRLSEAGVVVDSVSLGQEDNHDLTTLSYLLGSYRFHPNTLTNALAICELEPFLSLTERPSISRPFDRLRNRATLIGDFWRAKRHAFPTVANEHQYPERKSHPSLDDDFVQLAAAVTRPGGAVNRTSTARAKLRVSRLMNEMRAVANGTHPTYDVYVSERDFSFMKVVMSGPDDSPYSAGAFLLYIDFDESYPTFSPKARFITRIKHQNVNAHGRICHSIFDRDWTSDTSLTTILDSIYGLLLQPELSDPVNTTTTLGYHHDQVEFADEVRDHVRRYASMSREAWKNTILGLEGDSEDGDDGGGDDEEGGNVEVEGDDFDDEDGVNEEFDEDDVDEAF